jgi:hypothetical protein
MTTSPTFYEEQLNFTDPWDWNDDCALDCLWDRVRKSRLFVLRPLTIILSLIGIIGVIGNILVILVFSRTVKKRTSTYLVLTLAIIDLIACIIVIPGTLLKEWLFEFKSDLICKLWELMRNWAIISSAMILAAIALDRFLLVYKKTHQDGSKNVTMTMILVTMVTGIALGVPPMLGVGTYMETEEGGLINMDVCMPNDQLISVDSLFLYWQIVTSLFGLLILTIIVLYMLIFAMVYRHSTRIHDSTGLSSTQSKQIGQGTTVLPFVGFSKSDRPNMLKINTSNQGTQHKNFLTTRLNTMKNHFKRTKLVTKKADEQVITIKIVENSTTSTSTPNHKQEDNCHHRNTLFSKSNGARSGMQPNIPLVETKNDIVSHDHLNTKPANQRLNIPSTHNAPSTSAANQKQALPMKNRSAHIKTTKVLCIITTVYIIAFLPMFLITHKALEKNVIIFYLYFINNAANPVIYSFMNRKFRQDIWKMFSCRSNRVWTG